MTDTKKYKEIIHTLGEIIFPQVDIGFGREFSYDRGSHDKEHMTVLICLKNKQRIRYREKLCIIRVDKLNENDYSEVLAKIVADTKRYLYWITRRKC